MKKLLLLAASIILFSCSSSSPETTVKNYFNDVISLSKDDRVDNKVFTTRDIDPKLLEISKEMSKYIFFPKPIEQMNEMEQRAVASFGLMTAAMAKYEKIVEFQIADSKMLGDNDAVVTVMAIDSKGNKEPEPCHLTKVDGEWKIKFSAN